MSKFAIISAVLVVSMITVMGDFVVRDYVGRQAQTSTLTTGEKEGTQSSVQDPDSQNPVVPPTSPVPSTLPPTVPPTTTVPPVSVVPPSTVLPTSKLNGGIFAQAGFTGSASESHFDGKVFQLLDITQNPVAAINHWDVLEGGSPITSVTEIVLPDEIRALQMYVLLQNKTKTYIDLSLNETNAYGDRSFYINHAKKADEAFLTVKIGKSLFCFAYVKSYHPQIKALISLLAA